MKRIVWSLVFVLFTACICSAQSALYFPQFVDGTQGGGVFWGSIIAVTNAAAVGTPIASGTVTVTKDDGTPMNITFTDDTSSPTPNTFQLAVGQTKFFLSPTLNGGGILPFNVGFATVTSNLPVTAGLVFIEADSSGITSQAGVQGVTPLTRQASVAINSSSQNTGVAVAYPGTGTATVTYQLLDKSGSIIIPQVTRTLGSNNHAAFLITELFPTASQITGTLRIISDKPIVSVALLIAQPKGILATIPVFPVQ